MSYILQALEKNKDKKKGDSPVEYFLSESVVKPTAVQSSNYSIAWGILLTLAILSALLLGFWLGQNPFQQNPKVNISTEQIKKTSEKETTNTVSNQDVQSEYLAENPPIKAPLKIDSDKYFEQPPVKNTVQNNVLTKAVQTKEIPDKNKLIETTNASERINASEESQEKSYDFESVEGVSEDLLERFKEAVDETDVAKEQYSDDHSLAQNYSTVSPISDMPNWVKNGLPSLNFDRHIYASDGEGWVRVNGKDRYEQDRIADDLVLEKILPQQVVLIYQGERFTMPALSSW